MSDRTIRFLAGLLGGLIVFYLIVFWSTKPEAGKPLFQGDAKTIQKLVIQRGEESPFVMQRSTDGWMFTAPRHVRADTNSVEDFVQAVPNMRMEETISTRPENHESFELTENQAVRVQIFNSLTAEKPALDWLFGKTSAGSSRYFARRPDQADVLLLSGVPAGMLHRDLSGWRDKRLFPVHRDEIQKVMYRSDNARLEFERQAETVWRVNGVDADIEKVKELLQKLVDLRIDDFVDEDVPFRAASRIEVETDMNRFSAEVAHAPAESEKAYVRREDGTTDQIFPWRFNFLDKSQNDFLKTD